MPLMSHNNGVVIKLKGEHVSKYEDSPQMMMKVVWVVWITPHI
jgi:hypothetical protein